MTTITVEREDGTVSGGGPPSWYSTLSDTHFVWEKAGADLHGFTGRVSIECAAEVHGLIVTILNDPPAFTGAVSYYDLRGTVAALTGLFFTLREIPDGIVRVS